MEVRYAVTSQVDGLARWHGKAGSRMISKIGLVSAFRQTFWSLLTGRLLGSDRLHGAELFLSRVIMNDANSII